MCPPRGTGVPSSIDRATPPSGAKIHQDDGRRPRGVGSVSVAEHDSATTRSVIDRMCTCDRLENAVLDTMETATEYVIAELEAKGTATRDDFDVHAIVTESHEIADSWDLSSLDRDTFWQIAADHLRV